MGFFEKYLVVFAIGLFGVVVVAITVFAPTNPQAVAPVAAPHLEPQREMASTVAPIEAPLTPIAKQDQELAPAEAVGVTQEGAQVATWVNDLPEAEQEALREQLAQTEMIEHEMQMIQENEVLDESSFGIVNEEPQAN